MRARDKTAVVYARVSSARQADEGLPVESQLEQCHVKAKSLDATVLEVFRDDGISGRTSNRPGFMAALDFCDDNPVDYFICWSSSRFARNHIDAAMNKRVLEKSGVKLVFVSQDFGESEESWMLESIVAIMDEQYSRAIAKDTRRSMAKNAADGFWNGGRIPFGYKSIPVGKRRRLAIVEDEAVVVKMIFRWCIDGLGQKEIAKRLNLAGISRRGSKWCKASVGAVLSSKASIGQVAFNDRGREIIGQGHDPILSEDHFLLAQEQISSRVPINHGGRPRSTGVFSGLLCCGSCGKPMYTERSTGRNGTSYHYYNCSQFLKSGECESRRVSVPKLDEFLLEVIAEKVFSPHNIGWIVRDIKEQSNEWNRDQQKRFDAIAAEMADIDKRLKRLYDSIEAGAGLNLNDVAPRLRELRSRHEFLRVESETIAAEKPPEISINNADLDKSSRVFRDILVSADSPKKVREFVGQVINKITLNATEVDIEYHPERIVNAQTSGSQCDVRWLPDQSTLRTAHIVFLLPWGLQKAA